MELKKTLNKTILYPLGILSLIGFIVFSIFFMVSQMGLKINPPQPEAKIEQNLKPYVIWEDGGSWWTSSSESLSMFESKPLGKNKSLLSAGLSRRASEVVFLLIKSDAGKEKILSLLGVLAKTKLKKIYVASPFDNTLSNLKKTEPRFWYAPSPKAWVKWAFFSSYYIESIYNMKGDFLFIDEQTEKMLSPRLKSEVLRRNLPVIRTGHGDQTLKH